MPCRPVMSGRERLASMNGWRSAGSGGGTAGAAASWAGSRQPRARSRPPSVRARGKIFMIRSAFQVFREPRVAALLAVASLGAIGKKKRVAAGCVRINVRIEDLVMRLQQVDQALGIERERDEFVAGGGEAEERGLDVRHEVD